MTTLALSCVGLPASTGHWRPGDCVRDRLVDDLEADVQEFNPPRIDRSLMTEDQITYVAETMVLDAELHVAAAGIRAMLPLWFLDLREAHNAEVGRLQDAGHIVVAAVLAAHGPMFDDGAVCVDAHADADGFEDPQSYPCAITRALGLCRPA